MSFLGSVARLILRVKGARAIRAPWPDPARSPPAWWFPAQTARNPESTPRAGGHYQADSIITGNRANGPLFHGEGLRHVLAAIDQAKVIAAELYLTMPELALRWTLTNPAITSAIAGVKQPSHIEGVVKAADDVLPQRVWHQLATLFAQAKTKALAAASRAS